MSSQREFHISVLQLQWVINSVLLILTISMAILAKLADTYGRRLFLYLGLLLFGVASIGIGLSHHLGLLIGFRFLQGISIALLYMAPLAIVYLVSTFCRVPQNYCGKQGGDSGKKSKIILNLHLRACLL